MEATSHGLALAHELWVVVPARDLVAVAVVHDDTMQLAVREYLRAAVLVGILFVDTGTGCIIVATILEFEFDNHLQLLLTVEPFFENVEAHIDQLTIELSL